MSAIPSLKESDIRDWVGRASFERGRDYYRQGAIFNLRFQGRTLKGQCQGSLDEPYHVTVELDETGIVSGDCSCPVGEGGHCKHVAALLLTWFFAPDEFVSITETNTVLEHYTHAELLDLVKKMLERFPELDTLLERHPPRSLQARQGVNPDAIRRQVETAFRGTWGDWGGAYRLSLDLLDMLRVGHGYAAEHKWWDATVVYDVIARATAEHYGDVHDEGDVLQVITEAVVGLDVCLPQLHDPGKREIVLKTLFDIFKWDMEYGGVGVSDAVPHSILAHATPEERQRVMRWATDTLPAGDNFNAFRRQAYGGFLLILGGHTLTDEDFLSICRETGRIDDLVERLLQLGRVAQAETEARRAGDYPFLGLLDLFVAHGHAELAKRLVRARIPSTNDDRLLEWLKAQAEADGDHEESLSLAVELLWRRPSLPAYQEVRRLAQAVGRWSEMRPEILARLMQQGNYPVLTEVHLDEGEIDEALETLERIRGWQGTPQIGVHHVKVAQAAEPGRPEAAIRLYLQLVESLVAQRNRGAYAEAATYLVRMRELYHRLGQEAAWRELIANLRQQYRQLRAMQDEWNKARL